VTCDDAALGQGPEPSDLHAVYEEAVVGWECFRAEVDAAYDQFLNPLPLQDRDAWRL